MFYLPPLPDVAVINGGGHVEDSVKLEAFLIALAELDHVVIEPLPQPEPGANGHVAWHNAIVKNTKTVADSLGVPVTLPPLVVKAGELAHVKHHNLIRQALLDASTNAWNDATGGTISTYTVDGKKMRRHIFTASGAFAITRAFRPFTVYLIGGGAGGGHNGFDGGGPHGGGAGGGGGYYAYTGNLDVTSHPVSVGAAGQPQGYGGGAGGDSAAFGFVAGGGGGGAWGQDAITGGDGRAGVPPEGRGGDGGGANHGQTQPANGKQSAIGLPGNAGNGGAGGQGDGMQVPYPGQPGISGGIVIDYQIGTA